MPVYEYKCKNCGHSFEIIQKVGEPQKTICTECNGELYKVISTSGLIFKGSGWYITDYSNKSKEPKKTVADKETKSNEAKPTETASEKKEPAKTAKAE